jgi:hypothetical protein
VEADLPSKSSDPSVWKITASQAEDSILSSYSHEILKYDKAFKDLMAVATEILKSDKAFKFSYYSHQEYVKQGLASYTLYTVRLWVYIQEKVKLSLCLTKHYALKTYGEMDIHYMGLHTPFAVAKRSRCMKSHISSLGTI